MTHKHTPGPWVFNGGDSAPVLHIYGEDGPGLFNQNRPLAEQEANASLIAAAPELLEAARRALSYIERDEAAHGRRFGEGNALRAAIAKAEAVA